MAATAIAYLLKVGHYAVGARGLIARGPPIDLTSGGSAHGSRRLPLRRKGRHEAETAGSAQSGHANEIGSQKGIDTRTP